MPGNCFWIVQHCIPPNVSKTEIFISSVLVWHVNLGSHVYFCFFVALVHCPVHIGHMSCFMFVFTVVNYRHFWSLLSSYLHYIVHIKAHNSEIWPRQLTDHFSTAVDFVMARVCSLEQGSFRGECLETPFPSLKCLRTCLWTIFRPKCTRLSDFVYSVSKFLLGW